MEDLPSESSYASRIEQNNRYYARFAHRVKSRTRKRDYSAHLAAFYQHLSPKARILDLGCGSGCWFLGYAPMMGLFNPRASGCARAVSGQKHRQRIAQETDFYDVISTQ